VRDEAKIVQSLRILLVCLEDIKQRLFGFLKFAVLVMPKRAGQHLRGDRGWDMDKCNPREKLVDAWQPVVFIIDITLGDRTQDRENKSYHHAKVHAWLPA
jgi:hypothetical protein